MIKKSPRFFTGGPEMENFIQKSTINHSAFSQFRNAIYPVINHIWEFLCARLGIVITTRAGGSGSSPHYRRIITKQIEFLHKFTGLQRNHAKFSVRRALSTITITTQGTNEGIFSRTQGYCAALCSNDRISGRARFACLIQGLFYNAY